MELMISQGVRCAKAHIRLPIVIPLVAQGPTEVGPYGTRRPRIIVLDHERAAPAAAAAGADPPRPHLPSGDLIRLGQTMLDEDVLNVTILSGFGTIASRVARDPLAPRAAPVTESPSRGARQTSPTPGRTA